MGTTFTIQDGKIKKGKVFPRGASWIVSVPSSDGRTAFLEYGSEAEAKLAYNIFNEPVSEDDRKNLKVRKFLIEKAASSKKQACEKN